MLGLGGGILLGAQAGSGPSQPTALSAPPASADYILAYDVTNGWDLYTKAEETQWDSNVAASLIKLATALVLMDQKGDSLAETVTVAAADIENGEANSSSPTLADLQEDDVISYEDLLYGALLPSGNDAAYCIARNVGDFIYSEAGSTGNQGVTRFVEEMNALATTLGLSDTTFATPSGVNQTGNVSTARDITMLAKAAWENATIRTVSGSVTRTITITETNARTYDVRHTSALTSGPFNTPTEGIGFDGVLASKTGTFTSNSTSVTALWESPNGTEVVITVVSSSGSFNRYMDWHGIAFQIVQDFPYLVEGAGVGTDADFSDVVLLAGGDDGFDDESSYGRTLTADGATRTTTAIIGTHSFLFDGTDDRIEAADAAELSMGSEDFLVECYYRGDESEPGGNCVFVGKYDSGNNQREWSLQYAPGVNAVTGFVSTDGSAFTELERFVVDPAVFFNGATRHVALRRLGNEFAVLVDGDRSSAAKTISGALHAGTAKLMIGARQNNGTGFTQPMPGTTDEVRVTKGTARVSARKFTPTGRAFPRS